MTKDSRTYDATSIEIVLTGNMKIEICTHSRCSELVLNANKLVLEKSCFLSLKPNIYLIKEEEIEEICIRKKKVSIDNFRYFRRMYMHSNKHQNEYIRC